MKTIRVGLLAVALLLAGRGIAQDKAVVQKKSVGYDVGSCSTGSFVAAHVELGTDFVITVVSPGPDVVKALEKPLVYKFVKSDKDGKHYVNGPLEIVIVQADEKGLAGRLVKDGEAVAAVFGVPGDGSKLAENAKDEFGACLSILKETEEDPKESKS